MPTMVSKKGNGVGHPADVFAAVLLDTLPVLTLPQTPPERELVVAAKAGDGGAVAALYESYFPRVFRYIMARTGRVQDAEDLAQDVLLKVIEAIDRFQWRESPFSAWVFRIARNEFINKWRKDSRRVGVYLSNELHVETRRNPLTYEGLVDDQTLGDIDQRLDKQADLNRVAQACRFLTDAQREVIYLRFAADLTVAETAATMGKGEVNVKVIQHKAIARLRELLGVKISKSKAV